MTWGPQAKQIENHIVKEHVTLNTLVVIVTMISQVMITIVRMLYF